ncbi:hypothetical protein PV08_01501 [Exophiala spinifera]|uniref:Uncharacterized protein n=1 Tax=Exophiala spinifera TaxID=91928 RepID=A0A0D2A816_9EURO|nr:uncharacterized protein PV08_01501 [Exophiala spinifera]KIW20922.1 hypothetical protein PV08_01501 [Exophiala spinifera]
MSDRYMDRHYDYQDDKHMDRHELDDERHQGSSRYIQEEEDPRSSERSRKGKEKEREKHDEPARKRRDKSHLYDDMHKAYNTKALIQKYEGSDWYPDRDADIMDHAIAQTERKSQWTDNPSQATRDRRERARKKVSRENHENFNQVLPGERIEPRDWEYRQASSKHYSSQDPDMPPQVTTNSIERIKKKYPRK